MAMAMYSLLYNIITKVRAHIGYSVRSAEYTQTETETEDTEVHIQIHGTLVVGTQSQPRYYVCNRVLLVITT